VRSRSIILGHSCPIGGGGGSPAWFYTLHGATKSCPDAAPAVADRPSGWSKLPRLDEVTQLLRRAAELAAARGVESELFMQAAWSACLDARPGLREQIADKELRSQLRKLRSGHGRRR